MDRPMCLFETHFRIEELLLVPIPTLVV